MTIVLQVSIWLKQISQDEESTTGVVTLPSAQILWKFKAKIFLFQQLNINKIDSNEQNIDGGLTKFNSWSKNKNSLIFKKKLKILETCIKDQNCPEFFLV